MGCSRGIRQGGARWEACQGPYHVQGALGGLGANTTTLQDSPALHLPDVGATDLYGRSMTHTKPR